jgi:hypothetical protein
MLKPVDLGFTLPSDPKEKKKIRDIFYEMSGVQQEIKDAREVLKGFVTALNSDYGIPKKIIPKIAKIVSDHNFEDVSAEHTAIEDTYEAIMVSNNNDTTTSVSDED